MAEPATLEIEILSAPQMSERDLRGICELHHEAFFRPDRSLDQRVTEGRSRWIDGEISNETGYQAHVIRDDGRIVAVAITLLRAIDIDRGTMTVLGLAGVATASSHRGRGLGQRVIQSAWGAVDRGEQGVCLFQTGKARGLYERLGARVIPNRIVDSTHPTEPQANPFTDEVAMIYPGDTAWPEGVIDLKGPGY